MTIGGKIRVLLVEDHTLVRQGLRSALEGYPNIEVVGEAGEGEAAVLSALKLQPTAVVMDINLPKMDGITATRLIKKQNPHIGVRGSLGGSQGLPYLRDAKSGGLQSDK
ncbi:MAG TPA: response regulator transcription factor [Nitrospira sp.]|nr:response regulator transcription factor [Nitrospira sp.]